jgi:hypothetical protein
VLERAGVLRRSQRLRDPEEKREAITRTFYKDVFGALVKKSGARFLLQGTILTDVEETVAGVKRQHNVLAQLGIDPEEVYGYGVIEPLLQLRKDGVRSSPGRWGCLRDCTAGCHSPVRPRRQGGGRSHARKDPSWFQSPAFLKPSWKKSGNSSACNPA